jgi:hypothetical protein
MLGTWLAQGSPHYAWMSDNQRIAYISDIAASHWGYPLFIAGSATTVVVFDLAFISERWLRHKGRLAQNYGKGEKILSACAIFFSIVGAIGLIFLTIFNTRDHHTVHISMLVVFMCASYSAKAAVPHTDYCAVPATSSPPSSSAPSTSASAFTSANTASYAFLSG